MKKTKKPIGIIAAIAIIGLLFAGCGDPGGGSSGGGGGGSGLTPYDPDAADKTTNIGKEGPGGGIIFYYSSTGFSVTGLGTCYYLEVAPSNQNTSITWSSTNVNVTGATGTTVGTGKANTAAIIAAHNSDTTSNNAAKATNITIGKKNDWFLPSKDELDELCKVRNKLNITYGSFWSSSQNDINNAYWGNFTNNIQGSQLKNSTSGVRAIRAF